MLNGLEIQISESLQEILENAGSKEINGISNNFINPKQNEQQLLNDEIFFESNKEEKNPAEIQTSTLKLNDDTNNINNIAAVTFSNFNKELIIDKNLNNNFHLILHYLK